MISAAYPEYPLRVYKFRGENTPQYYWDDFENVKRAVKEIEEVRFIRF